MNKGRIKFYNEARGFGFIEQESGDDLFLHASELELSGINSLAINQGVSYEITTDKKGNHRACSIQLI